MKMLRKIAACFIAASLVFGSIPVHASNPSARNISIFRVDGDNVSLSRGDARSATPRDGQRLSEGNVLTTGLNSSVHVQMDTDSILQMSASSQVAVSQSGNNLVLSVQSGSALVEVRDQGSGNSTETRVGNVGLTVRGTMYTMGIRNDFISIVMLSGYGDVEGEPLFAGQIMHVFDEHRPGADVLYYETAYYRLITLDLYSLGELDLFTLEVMYEHSGYLLDVGTLTPEMLEVLPYFIHERRIEAEEALLAGFVLLPPTVIVPPVYEEGNGPVEPAPSPTPRPTPEPDNGSVPLGPGAGTASNPYRIRNMEDMERHFGTYRLDEWAGLFFELHTNIGNWTTVIGYTPTHIYRFMGSFNGRGHNINLNINVQGDDSPDRYTGLFAQVGGLVENLRVTGTVTSNATRVGGIAGSVEGGGTLRNVHAGNITVTGSNSQVFLGGIVGIIRLGGTIQTVSTSAAVRTLPPIAGAVDQAVGGIAGQIEGIAANVTVHATSNVESGTGSRGAIVGVLIGNVNGYTSHLPSGHPMHLQMVGSGVGIITPNLAGLAFPLLLLFEEEEECLEDYPAKEDENDYDHPAKSEEDDEELDNDDDEYEDDTEYNYGHEDENQGDEKDESGTVYEKQEDYVPTFPEDDFELGGYGNYLQ